MGKGDKRHRKQSIGVDLAEVPRKKAQGKKRMNEIRCQSYKTEPGRACVYVIEARGTEFLKIGVARNPYNRQKELQTGNPYELALLYALETDERLAFRMESIILKQPEMKNANGCGEWVDISPKVIPTLFALAAAEVGADPVWRFGEPAYEEPNDYDPKRDLLATTIGGYAVGRGKRRA